MIRLPAFFIAIVCLGWVSSASAQVFYEPVRYQYGSGAATFYYGGHDPRVLHLAAAEADRLAYSSVVTGGHVVDRTRVYSDVAPYENLADNEYTSYMSRTPADARNEANQNVPRYFRKRNLLRAAVVTEDGTIVVPAQAQPRMDMKVVRPFAGAMGPVMPKGTILVIPKKLLEPPAKKNEPSVVIAE